MSMKFRWPLPPTLLALAIAGMLALHFLLPLGRVVPFPWNCLGAPLILFGIIWNLWADRLFKRHRTTVKPHLQPTSLVSAGPFRLSRHPMYLGMIAIALGLAVVLGTLTAMLVALVFATLLAVKFVPMEERLMEQTFGDAWKDYRTRTRRWL